jgi:type I restriction enzyme, S subunit
VSDAAATRQLFGITRGDYEGRLDVQFYLPKHRELERRMQSCGFPIHRIGSAAISMQVVDGPFGSDLKVDDYVPDGVPLLRVSNCRTGLIQVDDEMVFISEAKHDELIRSEVLPGDVLLTKAGAILGYSAVFPTELKRGNITSHLASIRPAAGIESRYLCEFLTSSIGIQQIYRWGNKSTRPELNTDEVRALEIVLPPPLKQRELLGTMDAARAKMGSKLSEADTLLAELDNFLLATLGLSSAPRDDRKVFAAHRADVSARFDPHFHLPALAQNTRMLIASGAKPLGSLVAFSNETWRPSEHAMPMFRYIEISNVNSNTGEAHAAEVSVAEAPSRARMVVRTNDIIVSLTRPHHGSIALISPELNECVASTGFSVLRGLDEGRLNREYLWCVLRSKICLLQMQQRASGGNYPAIAEPELAKLLVPVPKTAVQEIIATEAGRRRDEARRLRAEAEGDWRGARQWFEEQLLGPAVAEVPQHPSPSR